MNITFEKRPNPVYPAYFRVGDYSVNLEPDLIQSLKEITSLGENTQFLSLVISKIGTNPYLREMIQGNIAKESNQAALALKMRRTINNL
ncbi:MAG: hypothetical protein ACE5F7_05935 [Nitrospiria bacterium]